MTAPSCVAAPPAAFSICAFSQRRVKLHLLSPSEVCSKLRSFRGQFKVGLQGPWEADIMLLSDASPVSTVTACILPSRCLFARHSMWFRHLDGAVCQTFACSPCCFRTLSPRHAIKTKFISVILCRAPTGSQVSIQFSEKLIFSSSAGYCCSYFPGAPIKEKEMTNQRGATTAALIPVQPQTPSV